MPTQEKSLRSRSKTQSKMKPWPKWLRRSRRRLVTIHSGASVNVGPMWFGESALKQSDGSGQLRGADGRTLHDYGKRHVGLTSGNHLTRCEFHVADVTEPEFQFFLRKCSCVRAEGLQNPPNSCVRAERLRKYQESCVELEKQSSDAVGQTVV